MALLVFKERLKSIYQKTEIYLKPIFRFLIAIFVFTIINRTIGYDVRLKNIVVISILSFVCAFTSSSILILLAATVAFLHIYCISKVLSILVLLFLLVFYLMFIRFTPKKGYVVLAVIILTIFRIPYIVPILVGLTFNPIGIIPVSCGIIIYYLFRVVKEVAAMGNNNSVEDIIVMYKYVIDNLVSNRQMLLMIIAFSIVIIIVYLIRKRKFDYAFNIAIVAGIIINILIFLIGNLILDIQEEILWIVIGSLISGGIALFLQFFILSLDYSRVENVQFEDDYYYYYVKAVPKTKVSVPEKNIKRINAQTMTKNTTDLNEILKDNDFDNEPYEYFENHSEKRNK